MSVTEKRIHDIMQSLKEKVCREVICYAWFCEQSQKYAIELHLQVVCETLPHSSRKKFQLQAK